MKVALSASGADSPNAVDNLRGMSFRKVSYHDLQSAAAQDAKQTFAIYTAMSECVKDHLEGGIFAGDALCLQKPYQRIEFAVVRQGFIDEWQPRGGIEARLVDMLTQTYLAWQFWLEMSIDGARNLDMPSEQITKTKTAYDSGNWQGPRVTQKEWYEHATQMADRFNRMFVRVLRHILLPLRSGPPIVHLKGSLSVFAEVDLGTRARQDATLDGQAPRRFGHRDPQGRYLGSRSSPPARLNRR